MSNDKGKNPMFTDNGENPVFTAFQNLSIRRNNNIIEQIGPINRSDNNINVQYNYSQISLGGSRSVRVPPSWISQPGFASSSTNSFQPMASSPQNLDENWLSELFDIMTSPTRYPEYLANLERINTYETAIRDLYLLRIEFFFITNPSTFRAIAINQTGSHAIRALLKRNPRLDEFIFDAVCRSFYLLMSSTYGRHLINPIIRLVDKPSKEVLYKLTREYALRLAVQETGCIALNNVLEEIRGDQRDLILDLIARNAEWLSFDPYGTHVVQNVLTLQNPSATRLISEKLSGSFFRLAMVRHGSYLVEKCLKSTFGREKVLEEFRGNDREWIRLANDKFGNFVAQCALNVMMQNGMRQFLIEFVDKLRPHFGEMKIGHGKNTLRMIEVEILQWIQIQLQENQIDSFR